MSVDATFSISQDTNKEACKPCTESSHYHTKNYCSSLNNKPLTLFNPIQALNPNLPCRLHILQCMLPWNELK